MFHTECWRFRAALRNRMIPPADLQNADQRTRFCILTADRRHVNATKPSIFGGENAKDLDSEHLLPGCLRTAAWPFGRAKMARWPTLPAAFCALDARAFVAKIHPVFE